MKIKTEILIIGGGVTGVGIARDLSLRGIPCVLLEKGDLLSGASGRNHGLLHSGARYAVSDPGAANECIIENMTLKKIAPHCVEDTGGLFISLPEDNSDFKDVFIKSCEKTGIPIQILSRDEVLYLEPNLNPEINFAIKVPDGSIDPFELVLSNKKDAEKHGAKFILHTEATKLVIEENKIKRVFAKNLLSGEEYLIESSYVINATGAWTNHFLKLAGLKLPIALSKGSMLITNQRLNQMVINRLRPPSDGDIIVPNKTVSILGTTSIRAEDPERCDVTYEEVSLLIEEATKMIPSIRSTRFIRAYSGIRPLYQSQTEGNDRSISRGFVLIDHEKIDELKNLITITGGKLITYRLMAEKTSDLVCNKMGIIKTCSTHINPLPGINKELKNRLKLLEQSCSQKKTQILCECELVSREEIEEILRAENLKDPLDILHRTRLAKGTCQGAFCIYRLIGVLMEMKDDINDPIGILKNLLEERWKGIRPILWGASIREEELIEGIYKGIFNLTNPFEENTIKNL